MDFSKFLKTGVLLIIKKRGAHDKPKWGRLLETYSPTESFQVII